VAGLGAPIAAGGHPSDPLSDERSGISDSARYGNDDNYWVDAAVIDAARR